MFIIQRIHEDAGDEGQDIRETLARGFADPDAALKHLRDQFKDDPKDPDEIDIEVDVTYNSKTKRFSVVPKERQDLLYHIVALHEVDIINGQDSNS